MSKVSVIIPTYNSSKYLRHAIASVLAQTYQHIEEVIVVDDGSTDGTGEMVKSIWPKVQPKVRYIYQPNQGPAPARNNGLRAAQGDYVAFLDADDIWEPLKLQIQIQRLKSSPEAGFVYCDNFFVDDNGGEIPNYVRKVKLVEGDVLLELFMDFFLITSGVVIKRACAEKIGYFDEKLLVGEDYEYFLRLAQAFPAAVVREKLYKRRVHARSLSRQDYSLDARNDIQTLLRFVKLNPDFAQHHQAQIRRRLGDYYYDFAYRLLNEGRNGLALVNTLRGLRYQLSQRNIKNLVFCLVPYGVRRSLKSHVR